MADTVTAITVEDYSGSAYITKHLTCVSDGTGETSVIKFDKSALTAQDGAEPASLDIHEIRWAIQGFSSVRLAWDHTADDTAMVLSGNGYDQFHNERGEWYLKDPRSAGGTGDILLTSVGAAANATYDITIRCKKQND